VGFVVACSCAAPSALAQDPIDGAYGGQGTVGGLVGTTTPTLQQQQLDAAQAVPNPEGTTPEAGETLGALQQPGTEGVPRQASEGPQGNPAALPATDLGGQSLPFTGFDLTLMVLGAFALLGLGLVLRRASRPVPPGPA
jgi:hypothetical protein